MRAMDISNNGLAVIRSFYLGPLLCDMTGVFATRVFIFVHTYVYCSFHVMSVQ